MDPNEMNIIVWALALLLPILPALLFFIPRSSTAEASTDDDHAKESQPEKVPFWAKWSFKLTGAAAAYLVFTLLALYYRPNYVVEDIFTVWGTVDVDQGQRPQLGELIFGTLPPPTYSADDGTFHLNVIGEPDGSGLPTLVVNWKDQKLLGNPDPVHLDPKDPYFDKEKAEISGHRIMVKKHFTMRATASPAPAYSPSSSETPTPTSLQPSAFTSSNQR